jgi:flagellar hook protein FlgE
MLHKTSLVSSVFFIATSLTACLDLRGEADSEQEMNAIAENISARATTRIQLVANLDATELTPEASFNVEDPIGATNFSTTISVYDAVGTAHAVELYFRRSAGNAFEYYVLASGDELDPIQVGKSVELGSGILRFDTDGTLLGVEVLNEVSALFAGTESPQFIILHWGSPKNEGGVGSDGVTMYARPCNVSFQSQNGHAKGRFAGVEVRSNNEVYARYTNGSLVRLFGRTAASRSVGDALVV